jgi:hypothetical protein
VYPSAFISLCSRWHLNAVPSFTVSLRVAQSTSDQWVSTAPAWRRTFLDHPSNWAGGSKKSRGGEARGGGKKARAFIPNLGQPAVSRPNPAVTDGSNRSVQLWTERERCVEYWTETSGAGIFDHFLLLRLVRAKSQPCYCRR